ncbi:fimbrial protein [Enterobacter sp. N18-03635]|uniref:fimbrial protein n=1 Tax=Enterobacter sp. N18-03635 TaxID=2500132 RepID=UPI000FD71567|nr:fimbrial protein [Enterobacter sp. N18-03635]AZV05978.1 fimbrial protein [Enterobacter sp. N18-03635]
MMRIKLLLLSLASVLFSTQMNMALALQTGDSMSISFTGRLINRKPCTINNGAVINVSFGNVNIDKVATEHITQPLDYTLACPGSTSSNTIQMTIKATPVTGDPAAMGSSATGLWLKFMNNGKPQNLNIPFDVKDINDLPNLEIELEKNPASELHAEAFTGTATLMAEFF